MFLDFNLKKERILRVRVGKTFRGIVERRKIVQHEQPPLNILAAKRIFTFRGETFMLHRKEMLKLCSALTQFN